MESSSPFSQRRPGKEISEARRGLPPSKAGVVHQKSDLEKKSCRRSKKEAKKELRLASHQRGQETPPWGRSFHDTGVIPTKGASHRILSVKKVGFSILWAEGGARPCGKRASFERGSRF